MKRWIALISAGIVVLYAALAIGAAGCLLMQSEEGSHAHHSPSHAPHSPLCTWSCQANPTAAIPTPVPLIGGVAFVAIQPLVSETQEAFLLSTVSRSRAPPA